MVASLRWGCLAVQYQYQQFSADRTMQPEGEACLHVLSKHLQCSSAATQHLHNLLSPRCDTVLAHISRCWSKLGLSLEQCWVNLSPMPV